MDRSGCVEMSWVHGVFIGDSSQSRIAVPSTFSSFSEVMSIDGVVLLSIDFWFTLSIAVAWRVSINTSLVYLRIVHKPAGSFFEEPKNLLFIVVPGTKMYVPETEETFLSVFEQ